MEAVVSVRLHVKPSELKPVNSPCKLGACAQVPPKLVASPCTQKPGGFGQLPLLLRQGSPGIPWLGARASV